MADSNYSTNKSTTSSDLKQQTGISSGIVTAIINQLRPGSDRVKVNDLSQENHILKATDLKGHDLVYSNDYSSVNLNSAKAVDVSKLAGLIFNSTADQAHGVNLTMNKGPGADAFKGSVVTYGTDDTIKLSGHGVKVSSGDGEDTVSTGNGNDSIDSASGNDSIISGNGDDTVSTGNGKDFVNSGAGNDSVRTGNGNDSVSSGTGNDFVDTGADNDFVLVGSGKDTVNTGSGLDIVKLAAGFTGTAKLDGGTQSDTLDLRLTDINNVNKLANGHVIVTLDNGSIINSVNFEKFIYDSNGTVAGGNIITIVGADKFDALDFSG